MKRTFLFLIVVFLISGCGEKQKQIYEEAMRKSATKYYETYMKSVNGQTENEITIEALKSANQSMGENYDLSELESCKDSSYVTIVADEKTREIEKINYHLNCK